MPPSKGKTKVKENDEYLIGDNENYNTPMLPSRYSRRTTARQSALKRAKLKLTSCDVPAIPEGTPRQLPSLPDRPGLGVATRLLTVSESYTYGEALVGSDSLIGSDWLHFLALQRGKDRKLLASCNNNS